MGLTEALLGGPSRASLDPATDMCFDDELIELLELNGSEQKSDVEVEQQR
jgi:hypothetical protein